MSDPLDDTQQSFTTQPVPSLQRTFIERPIAKRPVAQTVVDEPIVAPEPRRFPVREIAAAFLSVVIGLLLMFVVYLMTRPAPVSLGITAPQPTSSTCDDANVPRAYRVLAGYFDDFNTEVEAFKNFDKLALTRMKTIRLQTEKIFVPECNQEAYDLVLKAMDEKIEYAQYVVDGAHYLRTNEQASLADTATNKAQRALDELGEKIGE